MSVRAPTRTGVRWKKAWRIIASRFPPIHLFERASSKREVWDALIELEELTNPRIRDQVGDISLVPSHRRVGGSGATFVMAPFTHLNPKGSRFSDGTYGVFYCGDSLETALRESIHHFEQFARDSSDPARAEDMRVLVGAVDHEFHDVRTISKRRLQAVLKVDSYVESQAFGRELRDAGSDGLLYPSVRHKGGKCVAAFWPDVVGIPVQERHLQYQWNGVRVDRYFDYGAEEWIDL